jgi:uncharacterized protein YjiK
VTRPCRFRLSILVPLLFALAAEAAIAAAPGAGEPAYVRLVRTIKTDPFGVPAPAGLAYWPDANAYLVVESPGSMPHGAGADPQPGGAAAGVLVSPFREPIGSVRLPIRLARPLNMTWDGSADRLILLDSATGDLVEAALRVGDSEPWSIARVSLPGVPAGRIAGVTVAQESGSLFLLDGAARRVIEVEPDRDAGPDLRTALQRGRVSSFALPEGVTGALGGIAFDPTDGHLHLLEIPTRRLIELTPAGDLVARRDLSFLGLRGPQALMFAPSGDSTDDPAARNLFIADTGGGSGPDSGGSGTGAIFELSLVAPAAVTIAAEVVQSSLVSTIDTSRFSPASPDPSGLAFIPSQGRLVCSDGEVDEMSIYRSVNVWETSLGGNVVATSNTTAFSNEPTGVAYNPANGHWFFTDDDQDRVFEVIVGGNGRPGGGDDTVTSFRSANYGGGDPEGIAYDTRRGRLFLADGENGEIYEVAVGTGARLSQFDTRGKGYADVEGVEYNPDSDTLYVCSHGVKRILETTVTGTVIREIDVSFLPRDVFSGLAYAPASNDPSARSLYIADRGVDNDSNPNENDGRIFEVTVPGAPCATCVCGNGVREGAEVCDGADLAGQTCTSQGFDSGTLRCRSDCLGFDTSECATGNPGTVEVRVAAAADDAEELLATGAVSLTSSDLEMVLDGTDQVVGLRFATVPIARDAAIAHAWVQFTADESSSVATSLRIEGQAADNPPAFTTTAGNISSRPRTASFVQPWAPPAWNASDGAGPNQRTPDIAPIIQEIVRRGGWAIGNALVILVGGTGHRVAEAYDKGTAGAPLLIVELGATTCGDGVLDPGEACDSALLGGATCADRGCTGGTPACSSSCTVDYSACTGCVVCGNGVREGSETCDGNDLAGQTCVTQGFGSGALRCRADCAGYDVSACSVCDLDGVCDAGENCTVCPGECVVGGPVCGNDVCETANGEDCRSCPADCNGIQGGKPGKRYCCGDGDGSYPVGCGDSRCTASGNLCSAAATPVYCCGDGTCQDGETATTCAVDCGP